MNDLESRIRATLGEHEREIPHLDSAAARPIARRARRRQVVTVAGSVVLGVLLVAGAAVGVGALLRADRATPADLEPPARAPITVARGEAEGWRWLLSTSADGTCVALTDAQGSTTSCATDEDADALPGMPSRDIVDVGVRSPIPPGPELAFVFGRVSARTAMVYVSLRSFDELPVRIFAAPQGVESRERYYLAWIAGNPYPIVPDAGLVALDADQMAIDAAEIERPDWALPPFTTLSVIASGRWGGIEDRLPAREWEIGIYRDEATGDLCFGDQPGIVCGPADDPAPAWGRPWGGFETVSEQSVKDGPDRSTFVWGVFEDPVMSVRVELDDGRTLEPAVYPPPTEYPLPFSVFVFEFDGNVGGRVLALDAAGEVVARRAVGLQD